MTTLPSGWAASTLGETCTIASGSTPRTNETSYWDGDIPWITPDDLSGHRGKMISRGRRSLSAAGLASCSARMLPAGTVLFTSRAPIGYVAIAGQSVCTNQGFKSLIPPPSVRSDFLYWYMQHATPLVRERASGTTFPEVSAKGLASVPLPVPPIAEQDRIIAGIEEQFSRLDAGVAALRRVRLNLKRMRSAVLIAGLTGALGTQNSSDEPAARLLERIATAKRERGLPWPRTPGGLTPQAQVPDGWEWVHWQDIAWKIGDVDHKMPPAQRTGVPYVSPRDFVPENGIDFEGAKKISIDDFKRLAAKIQPKKGDLIYPRYGTIGECRLVSDDRDFLVSYSCALVKTMCGFIDPRYQYYFGISPLADKQALAAANDTTQANVGLQSIQRFAMPIPPLAEQSRIAGAIHQATAGIDALEASLERWDTRCGALRSSTLAAAFAGQLLPQDPHDEPASALLNRIAAERAASNGYEPTWSRKTRGRMTA